MNKNKNITFKKDKEKSYVYIEDNKKTIGILVWHFQKKKWLFNDCQKKIKKIKK